MGWGFWKRGKQPSGYFKRQLFSGRFPFSWNLILYKYPKGSFIPWHRSHGRGRHYYLFLELWPAWEGGSFEIAGNILGFPYYDPYFAIFRADQEDHQITEVLKGTKIALILHVQI